MSPTTAPIIVISYNEEARSALLASLQSQEVSAVACTTFLEAEQFVIQTPCLGFLVDLTSIVKAKGEEKVVACTLTNFFPTMRVRTMGNMLVPMTMPGQAKQDSSLGDFLTKTCAAFTPRTLRSCRRHPLCLATLLPGESAPVRAFTGNISWSGAFIVHMNPEQYAIGDSISIQFPEFQVEMTAIVRWIQPWGGRRQPGFGVRFHTDGQRESPFPGCVLKQSRSADRDRLPHP